LDGLPSSGGGLLPTESVPEDKLYLRDRADLPEEPVVEEHRDFPEAFPAGVRLFAQDVDPVDGAEGAKAGDVQNERVLHNQAGEPVSGGRHQHRAEFRGHPAEASLHRPTVHREPVLDRRAEVGPAALRAALRLGPAAHLPLQGGHGALRHVALPAAAQV